MYALMILLAVATSVRNLLLSLSTAALLAFAGASPWPTTISHTPFSSRIVPVRSDHCAQSSADEDAVAKEKPRDIVFE